MIIADTPNILAAQTAFVMSRLKSARNKACRLSKVDILPYECIIHFNQKISWLALQIL